MMADPVSAPQICIPAFMPLQNEVGMRMGAQEDPNLVFLLDPAPMQR
jgi:hypothetical protein